MIMNPLFDVSANFKRPHFVYQDILYECTVSVYCAPTLYESKHVYSDVSENDRSNFKNLLTFASSYTYLPLSTEH